MPIRIKTRINVGKINFGESGLRFFFGKPLGFDRDNFIEANKSIHHGIGDQRTSVQRTGDRGQE